VGDEDGLVVHQGDDGLVRSAQVLAPLELRCELGVLGIVLDPGLYFRQVSPQVDQFCCDLVLLPLLDGTGLLFLQVCDPRLQLSLLRLELLKFLGHECLGLVRG